MGCSQLAGKGMFLYVNEQKQQNQLLKSEPSEESAIIVPTAATNDQNKMERTLLRREHNNNNWSQRVEGFNVSRSEDSTTTAAAAQQQQQQQHVLVDLFMNERFNDQSSSRPTRNRSRGSPTRTNFLPRMVTGQSNQLMLQQAQAHLQAMEFSKLSGVFRGLVGSRDSSAGSRADSSTQKICKLCCFWQERNIAEPPFHWCVNDAITMGFRGASPAGPIGRPTRRTIEAAT